MQSAGHRPLGTFLPPCWSIGTVNVLQLSAGEPSSPTHMQKPYIFSLNVLIQVASLKFPFTGSPSKWRWKPSWPTAFCRKWAMSKSPWLSISEQQIVELLRDCNAQGRWEGEAVRAGDLSAQQRALPQIQKAKLSCLFWVSLWSVFLVIRLSLTSVILKTEDCLIRWAGG